MFNDLEAEREYLGNHLDINSSRIISHAIDISNKFIEANKGLWPTDLSLVFLGIVMAIYIPGIFFYSPPPTP